MEFMSSGLYVRSKPCRSHCEAREVDLTFTQLSKSTKPIFVAIVGGSGAGKSWLADRLEAQLGKQAGRLSLDDFYRDRSHLSPARRAGLNFDHPRAIDWPELERALKRLAAGKSARLPVYDFATHSRSGKRHVLRARAIILVDGLWLLHRRALRQMFDFSIFVRCRRSIRLARRLARDLQARGRTALSVRDQFRRTVEPMHVSFVAPQEHYAECVLDNCGAGRVKRLARQILALANH
jgi:uridine kinase